MISLIRRIWVLIFLSLVSSCVLYGTNSPEAPLQQLSGLKSLDEMSDFLPITPQPEGKLCWEDAELLESYTWENYMQVPWTDSGIGYGVGLGDVYDSKLLGANVYSVKSSTKIRVGYHIWYPKTVANSAPLPLRIMLILDERQMRNFIQNMPDDDYYDILLMPGDEEVLNLEVPALSPGIHELIVILLSKVEDEPDPHGHIETADSRITLISGDEQKILPRTYERIRALGSIPKGDPSSTLMLSLDDTLKNWNWPKSRLEVPMGETLHYNVMAGYEKVVRENNPGITQPTWIPFTLITFLDYRQVEIAPDKWAFYGQVSDDTAYAKIATEIKLPATSGRHDLLVVRINYPGIPMCILRGPVDGLSLPDNISATRVGIEILPSSKSPDLSTPIVLP